ncbi:MAG: hypothetical protein KAX46_06450 [Chromatiaceae bacterium]|nr:hypothetical protein [Chromatiaceae bacterium]
MNIRAPAWQPESSDFSPYLYSAGLSEKQVDAAWPSSSDTTTDLGRWTNSQALSGNPAGVLTDVAHARAVVNQALLAKLAEYTHLPDDWDGYGGKAAAVETYLDTFDFLTQLPVTFPPAKPMIAGSGVIGLYWEGNGCYASVEFAGGGAYCYIADTPHEEHGEDSVPVKAPLSPYLAEVIVATAGAIQPS